MERLVFGWDFEVDAWSKFWNLIKICVWTCDMNSTLGSVVPLAMFLIYQWHLVINWVLVNGLYWNTSEVDWTCCFSVKIRWISFGHFWIFFISIVRCWKDDFFYLKVLHNICHALTKDLQLQTIPIICRLGRWFPQINFSLKIVFQSNCAVNPIIYYWMSQRQVKFKNEIFWNCFLT